jgi:REP element-mobilizing transposase RayT
LVAHVVWAVKHRRPALAAGGDAGLIAMFSSKAHDVGASVLAAGCAEDHVHVLLRFSAAEPLSDVVKRLKGASSRAHNLADEAQVFRWQDGFWAQSCSPKDLDVVRAYVLGQRVHRANPSEPEPWEDALREG